MQSVQIFQCPKGCSVSDTDLDSFSRLQTEITERVREVCPDARWVWKNRNPRRSIALNETLVILLNRAGGYRHAELRLENGELAELIYQAAPYPVKKAKTAEPEVVYGEPLPENYDLIAFEWVDKHLLELNGKLNEAIGLGHMEYRITPDALPQPESWDAIQKELQRNGLKDVAADPDGILIKLRQ